MLPTSVPVTRHSVGTRGTLRAVLPWAAYAASLWLAMGAAWWFFLVRKEDPGLATAWFTGTLSALLATMWAFPHSVKNLHVRPDTTGLWLAGAGLSALMATASVVGLVVTAAWDEVTVPVLAWVALVAGLLAEYTLAASTGMALGAMWRVGCGGGLLALALAAVTGVGAAAGVGALLLVVEPPSTPLPWPMMAVAMPLTVPLAAGALWLAAHLGSRG
ncbi:MULTISPECIES: hypothetical protein [Kytococcus]|uniref:hypothetical protein n=1 Tax=Kytococcus TaxID=57499 RepID=UPI001141ADD4|nr:MULTISPECIES: hypothetical protein [Kytococcus]